MTTRKKWRLDYPGAPDDHDEFTSQAKAYDFVTSLRSAYMHREPSVLGALRPGVPNPTTKVLVMVDEGQGRGWELFERIDFEKE